MSVLIRCHNQAAFIAEAIESVLCQSRLPDEIVVVDDGSDDAGASIARELLDDARFASSVLDRRPARGAVATANDVVRASHGDLLVLLDADDRMSRTYLADLEAALQETRADFAYAGEILFGAVDQTQDVRPFQARELRCENFVNISAMFRRRLFDRVGGFRAGLEGIGFEDWDFWLSAVELGMIGVPVDTCWLEYRRHSTGSRNARSRVQMLRMHVALLRLHPTMRPWDVARWAGRAMLRTANGQSRSTRGPARSRVRPS